MSQAAWLDRRRTAPHQQRDYEQHEEYEEENLRDSHCRSRNAAESEDRSDDSDDQEGNGPR
jgi:hypothetical protein